MCKKERTYEKGRIELCRNCRGLGFTITEGEPARIKCPVCVGSGKIKRTVKIDLTIEPCAGPAG